MDFALLVEEVGGLSLMRLEVTGRRHFGGKGNPACATVFLDRVSENTLDKFLNR